MSLKYIYFSLLVITTLSQYIHYNKLLIFNIFSLVGVDTCTTRKRPSHSKWWRGLSPKAPFAAPPLILPPQKTSYLYPITIFAYSEVLCKWNQVECLLFWIWLLSPIILIWKFVMYCLYQENILFFFLLPNALAFTTIFFFTHSYVAGRLCGYQFRDFANTVLSGFVYDLNTL